VAGLTENRGDIARLLWRLWSPHWTFDDATFERTAVSFDNPDFVAVVIQSYRHRYGCAAGDPAVAGIEAKLAAQPNIPVPTINLHGDADGVGPASERDGNAQKFTGSYERRMLARVGHNVPQEAPAETVARSTISW
jgi:pimeloyl-ACP methyl ester carboxylesterase